MLLTSTPDVKFQATQAHNDINECADSLREALQDLTISIEQIAAEAGVVTSLLEQINKAVAKIDERCIISPKDSFVDFQTRMVNAAKEIAKTSTDMVSNTTFQYLMLLCFLILKVIQPSYFRPNGILLS
jgi:hypothetical protein